MTARHEDALFLRRDLRQQVDVCSARLNNIPPIHKWSLGGLKVQSSHLRRRSNLRASARTLSRP